MATPAIASDALTKSYGNRTVVDDFTFRVNPGEVYALVGPNGAGKTTVIRLVAGLAFPTSGQVSILGKDPHQHPAVRRELGAVVEAPAAFYPYLSGRANLRLHADLAGGVEPGRIDEVLRLMELDDAAERKVGVYSLGMRQRLSLAVAMVHRPELLILDEPTSGVDPVARDSFWRLLVELSRRDQVTIFISTHFMNEAARCDRMSMMHAGQVLDSDTPAALMEKRGAKTLEEAFIGYLIDAGGGTPESDAPDTLETTAPAVPAAPPRQRAFSLQRLYSYFWRESLELARDPVRATLALVGTLVLMLVTVFAVPLFFPLVPPA